MSSNSTVPPGVLLPTSLYGYVPTFWICCMFVTLFGLTTIFHIGEMLVFKPRLYWILPTTALCGIGETIGWSARLWSSKNPIMRSAFLMQISTTIISPVFLTAALYTILGIIIDILGPQYSRLESKKYLKIFVTADVFALLIQAAGGGIASVANDHTQANMGSHIMLAGIFFQMAAMLCYTLLAAEFLLRFYLQKPLRKRLIPGSPAATGSSSIEFKDIDHGAVLPARIGLMVLGLALATLFVFIRTFYRTVELIGGWRGRIIRTQIYFNLFDATPIALALFVLNFLSPTFLLRRGIHETF